MKKITVFGFIIFICIVVVSAFYKKAPLKENTLLENKVAHFEPYRAQREITVQNTAQLKEIFENIDYKKVPDVALKAFPADFAQKGNVQLFQNTLLPIILYNNEKINYLRQKLQQIKENYEMTGTLTAVELTFLETTADQYAAILYPDISSTVNTLLQHIQPLPPAILLAFALVNTENGTKNLKNPFGLYAWQDKRYQPMVFDTLFEAVKAEIQEIFTMPAYRRARLGLYSGERARHVTPALLTLLNSTGAGDKNYTDRVKKAFLNLNWEKLDAAVLSF